MTDNGPPASIDQFIPGLCRASAIVSGCRRPTPNTWNLERPACFEIVPTAARSGAADKSALPMTTPPATPCLRMATAIDALTREYREIVLHPGFSSKAEPGAISSSRCQTTRTRPSEPSRVRRRLLLDERTTDRRRWSADDGGQTTDENDFLSSVIRLLSSGSTSGLVEPDGIEPTTSCLQSRRSPN